MTGSIRWKLALVSLVPLVLATALLGLYLVYAFERDHAHRMQQDLAYDARVVATLAAPYLARGGNTGALQEIVSRLPTSQGPEARVEVYNSRGALVAASTPAEQARLGSRALDAAVLEALQGPARARASQGGSGQAVYAISPVVAEGDVVGAVRISFDVSHVQPVISRLRLVVVSGTLAAALLAGVLAWALGKTISGPILRLAAAAKALAAGDLSQRVDVLPNDEVGLLADSFNRLAARLEELETARRDFLADAAHDLRAPAGAIRAAAETLLDGAGDNPSFRQRLLEGIQQETGRLDRLTEDLALLASFEAGQPDLKLEPVSLAEVVRETLGLFEVQAQKQSIELASSIPSSLTAVSADRHRLAQVLTNLMTNALKFAPPGGTVAVRAGEGPDHVWASVADTGPGIKAEDLDRLFDRFFRGNRLAGRSAPGMGLGLAITKRIVEAHGGTIYALSREGKGSVFTFTLPKP